MQENAKFKRKAKIEFEIVKRTYEKNKFNQWSGERPEKFFRNSGTKSKDENNDLNNDGYEGQTYDQRNISVSKEEREKEQEHTQLKEKKKFSSWRRIWEDKN